LRPFREVLAAGFLAGTIAGLATGAIDTLWSWDAATQFLPGFTDRLRWTLFVAAEYATAGAIVGLVVTAAGLALSRASLLGDLLRHGLAHHAAQRARDPGLAVAGLAFALTAVPTAALALYAALRLAVPYVANRKEWTLVVIVAMAAALVAVAAAVVLALLLARTLEAALAPLARRAPALASPRAPPLAALALIALAGLAALVAGWETARLLPLRAPAVALGGAALAAAAARPALALALALARRGRRAIAAYAVLPVALFALVLVAGGSPDVIKATAAYTGIGGPIAHGLRRAFDRDRDGYARYLGGGDCDDADATVHPGAPEIPDDGVDQNCVGGDASSAAVPADPGFVHVPPTVPADARILLITIDTARADHFGMYGYARATSPHLDALARDATVFEHGWAHAPSTRYSMPAILTGRLPLAVRYDTSVAGWPGLATRATTIAEALQSLGFATGAITNYWYFDRARRMDQGFAEYDNANAARHTGVTGAGPEQTRGSSSKEQTDKAIAFVERHAADRWFLWVHYYDPHYAYEPHAEVPRFGTSRVDLYDGELAFTDLHIGRLLDALRARGLLERTIVAVTGDHGEGFGEHGIDLHGYHLYAAQTRVPLIIHVPGLPPHRSSTPAGHVDLFPTLLNLAGGRPDPELMGRSLVDVLASPAADRDRVVIQQLSYENHHELRAAASRQCHVIYNVSPDSSWEVYRTDDDPAETRDLAGDPDACAETRAALERTYDLEQVPAGAVEALLPARPALAAPLDADLGDAVRLLACEPAVAGGAVTLTWTFEARAAMRGDWKVFVHITGPGATFLNGDHAPARPFAWWQPGQFIRYATTINLPRATPPGRYTVRAGLFRGAERAVASAPRAEIADNAVTCATIDVPAPMRPGAGTVEVPR
jgi:choline-sulfatase